MLSFIAAFPFLAAGSFLLGAARYTASRPDLDHPAFIAAYNEDGLQRTITGVISAPPDHRDGYTLLKVQTEAVRLREGIEHKPASGLLLARVEPGEDWRYGDRVVITGKLETPPENESFSYRDYLARQGVYAMISFADGAILERDQGHPLAGSLFRVRAAAFSTIHRLYPDPAASLLAGILLGIESGIPADLQEAFRDTGTSHIIAISGFNITLLSAIFLSLFGRIFGKRVGAGIAIVVIGLYTVLVGADAAVLRASVMGVLAILLRDLNRPRAAAQLLAFTAAVMAFANPLVLGDVGFQLSFAATAGLVRFADPMTDAFAKLAARYLRISTVRRITPHVADAVLLTLAAQVTTLPVIIFHFQRVSFSSLLVNPLILPIQPAVMIFGAISLMAGMAWLPAGQLLAALVQPTLAYTIGMVELFGRIRTGVLVLGETGLWVAILSYLLIFGLPVLGRELNRLGQTALAHRGALLAGLVLVTAVVFRAGSNQPDGLLRITILDAGMGDGVFVRGPTGRSLLIDGGPALTRLSDQLGRRISGRQQVLDWLFVAGVGDDQLAALPGVLERFPPQNVLWAGNPNASRSARLLQEKLAKWNTPVWTAEAGQRLEIGAGAGVNVLAVRNGGAVLRITWENFSALLPIGQDFETLALEQQPASLVMMAAGGYAPLNPPDWIAGLQPEAVVVSVAAGNREGLPPATTLEALQGYNLFRTDQQGWIEVVTDGSRIWFGTEN